MSVVLVTLPAVPIVRAGTFKLSSGETTFSEEDIAAAADAFATDPAVKAPRIRIASLEKALNLDPTEHGGEPAFGWADNLTVSENGQELLADIHVPEWIAAAMEYAYPSLSIEGTPPGWVSATGRKHDLVITAVALLGVDWPGITTLDDFRDILANGPELADAPVEATVMATMAAQPRHASLDADLVTRRFIDQLDTGAFDLPEPIASAYDVWPRTMRFDDGGQPYLKVTDEVSGTLYRVDFEVAGNEVTFADFVEVVEQDVPVAATMARPSAPIRAWASRDAVRASFPADNSPNQEDDDPMNDALRRTLAARHGLDPETATEEQIMAAETTAAEPDGTPAAASDPAAEGEPNAEGGTENADELAGVTARTTTISRERLAELERGAADGAAARAAQIATERDSAVAAAVADGRITPAEAPGWRTDFDRWPDAMAASLTRLEKGKYPGARASAAVQPQDGTRPNSLTRALAASGLPTTDEKGA